MKTTLHYIIAILLFSLNAAHAFAGEDKLPFTIIGNQLDYEYSAENKLLTITGDGLTIKGNGTPVDCGIKLKEGAKVTIKNLHLQTDNPLKIEDRGSASLVVITLEGTNILESTNARSPGMLISPGVLTISGNGSLTVIGSEAAGVQIDDGLLNVEENAFVVAIGSEAAGVQNRGDLFVEDNAFVVAIGAGGNEAINGSLHHESGLLIQGLQDQSEGTIKQTYSKLKGDNFTLGGNAEIPEWATVTIAAGQTFVIDDGITLTNKGTIVNNGTLANNGTLTNKGSFTTNGTFTNSGTVESNTSLNIGGEEGFDVTNTGNSATFSYDGTEGLLTIGGTDGGVLIKGRNKDHAVKCGIVIAQDANFVLTIEDLNIEAGEALKYNIDSSTLKDLYLTLQGTNRLTSTCGPGINLNGNFITFLGSGSLTVTGGDGAAGIQADRLVVYNANAFVVAIGGKGASGIKINGSPYLDRGLLI